MAVTKSPVRIFAAVGHARFILLTPFSPVRGTNTTMDCLTRLPTGETQHILVWLHCTPILARGMRPIMAIV